MNGVSPLVSRAAALALLVALIAAVALFVVAPLWDGHQRAQEEIVHKRDLIARMSRVSGRKDHYVDRIAALRAGIEQSGVYVRAETEALAAAALQQRIKEATGAHGGVVSSVQNLPSSETEGLVRVGVRVMMTASLEEIFYTLHDLESGAPILFVDNLDIKSNAVRRGRIRQSGETLLTIRFDLLGYLPPEAAS